METLTTDALIKENEKLKAQNAILRGFVDSQLTHFESEFKEDPDRFGYEQMNTYTKQAIYMEKIDGRKNIVYNVWRKMDGLLIE